MVGDHPGYGTPQFSPSKEILRRSEYYQKKFAEMVKYVAGGLRYVLDNVTSDVSSQKLLELTVDMYKHILSGIVNAFGDKVDKGRLEEIVKELDTVSIEDTDKLRGIVDRLEEEAKRLVGEE